MLDKQLVYSFEIWTLYGGKNEHPVTGFEGVTSCSLVDV